jgi:hypothetical protein
MIAETAAKRKRALTVSGAFLFVTAIMKQGRECGIVETG